jgi:hypothetical protein
VCDATREQYLSEIETLGEYGQFAGLRNRGIQMRSAGTLFMGIASVLARELSEQ